MNVLGWLGWVLGWVGRSLRRESEGAWALILILIPIYVGIMEVTKTLVQVIDRQRHGWQWVRIARNRVFSLGDENLAMVMYKC
jgi:uncharacterized membrane protein HdeD (DUF308 family)